MMYVILTKNMTALRSDLKQVEYILNKQLALNYSLQPNHCEHFIGGAGG